MRQEASEGRVGATHRPAFFSRLLNRAQAARSALAEMFYGMMGFEFEREAAHIRADLENLFVFVLMGDLLGVPILPPYYNLRLLPYLVETIPQWRRRVLRERHQFEGEEYDLHGI